MDNFSIALLFIFFVVFFVILMNYNEQENTKQENINEGFFVPYPKEENVPSYGNLGYGPMDSSESLSNKKLINHDDYVVTSTNKIADDYNRLVFPNQNDEYVPYGDTVCKLKNSTQVDNPNEFNAEKVSIPKIMEMQENEIMDKSCPNKSLNELHKSGNVYTKNGSVCHQKMSTDQMTSSFPYKKPVIHGYNTNKEDLDEVPIDPGEFYRSIYKPRKAYLEDERFAGWNYNAFENNGAPADVGYIPLSKTNSYPVGMNFAFSM